jgi:hypothetical protein
MTYGNAARAKPSNATVRDRFQGAKSSALDTVSSATVAPRLRLSWSLGAGQPLKNSSGTIATRGTGLGLTRAPPVPSQPWYFVNMKIILAVVILLLTLISEAVAQQSKPFDGYWFSQEYMYAFKIYQGVGVATLSNSPNYKAGDVMLRINRIEGSTFKGTQIFTDGKWYAVEGKLSEVDTLRMVGDGFTWTMIRR